MIMKNLLILFFLFFSISLYAQHKQKVWLDADTGNEMDDVYAIIRLLWAKDELDIIGLSSAHFNNADLLSFEKWNQYTTLGIKPVQISQRLNEEILQTMGLTNIAHPLGADRQMGRAWGGFEPRPSPATEMLLTTIKSLPTNEKLDILTIGASTNIASLIAIDSTVKSKIRLFSMGGRYDVGRKVWSKNEFNVRCDLNAFDFLLNQTGLDWTIIPVETCVPYQFDRAQTYAKLDDRNATEQLMEKRWRETNPEDKTRILWDLALVQAYLLPKNVAIVEAMTPSDNHQHTVKIYSKIDLKAFYDDFWGMVVQKRNNFQMPSHKPKLGQVHYGNKVGGLIGQEGATNEVIGMEENDQIQQIKVCLTKTLDVVKGLELEVLKKDGKIQKLYFGNTTDGVWQAPYKVKKGVSLIGISGASGWYIDSISFLFSDGSKSPTYGGKGGDNDYKLQITKNNKGQFRGRLMGFWGSMTDKLESIGLVFFPLE
jgi:inosine-uridine nucleoside N-ribohydrolase